MPSPDAPIADRVLAIQQFVDRFPTKKAAAEALSLQPSQISHALSEKSVSPGRLETVELAIDRWRLQTLTGQGDGAGTAGDAPPDPMALAKVRHGGYLDLSDRVPVPVVEVAGGPSGRRAIEDHTLYLDYVTPEEFVMTFAHPVPAPPPPAAGPFRWCLGLLRGESMMPRYEDGERVPIELFDAPRSDVAGGDVYLVRLDGHLYLKVVDRVPRTKSQPARHVLISYNAIYKPVEVPVEEGMDFWVLGRVVESSKQRQYGVLLARYLNL